MCFLNVIDGHSEDEKINEEENSYHGAALQPVQI